jgi:protein-tyrosine-phosphatase
MSESTPRSAHAPDPAASGQPPTILFVCLGNLCRSPMAEELMKKRLAELGRADHYRVRSAGIIAQRDQVPPIEAVRAAAEHQVDLRRHLSTPLTAQLIDSAFMVVAMDRMNVEHILNLVPDLGSRLRLLTQFISQPMAGRAVLDVPDPIGGSPDRYRQSYQLIAAGVGGLIAELDRASGE